jgi:hypothetical protein
MRRSGMHSNVMHRFMMQAFQDPPLWSSTAWLWSSSSSGKMGGSVLKLRSQSTVLERRILHVSLKNRVEV